MTKTIMFMFANCVKTVGVATKGGGDLHSPSFGSTCQCFGRAVACYRMSGNHEAINREAGS